MKARTPGGMLGRAMAGLKARWTRPGFVLMYHRVAEEASDPWKLAVSPARFEQQLEVLREHCEVVPLRDLLKAAGGWGARPAAAVTFDDGYADNFLAARPLLAKRGLPATFFLASGSVGGAREFWWDELEGVLLRPGSLPERLEIEIGRRRQVWELGLSKDAGLEIYEETRFWRPWESAPTPRHAAYSGLWRQMQAMREMERQEALDQLCVWAGRTREVRETHRPMSAAEAGELSRGGLFEIGAHTMTHALLPALSGEEQFEEIHGSKRRLEELTGKEVRAFSYPHGEWNPETIRRVREAGFELACSTSARRADGRTDRWRAPRWGVEDWGADEFERRLLRL